MYKLRVSVQVNFENTQIRNQAFERVQSMLPGIFSPGIMEEGEVQKWDEVEVQVSHTEKRNVLTKEL